MDSVYVLKRGTGHHISGIHYSVVGVFSNPEAAAEVRRKLGCYDLHIEEFRVDELVTHQIGPRWLAQVRISDGAVHSRKIERNVLRHPEDCIVDIRAAQGYVKVLSPISEDHAREVVLAEWERARSEYQA